MLICVQTTRNHPSTHPSTHWPPTQTLWQDHNKWEIVRLRKRRASQLTDGPNGPDGLNTPDGALSGGTVLALEREGAVCGKLSVRANLEGFGERQRERFEGNTKSFKVGWVVGPTVSGR